ncbi:uridine phosphorylase [Catalinimonas alkaloidigena]|uniref:Uridine phosphorylase n=1 Tax=Catalinimonas alkaloidigena TaxID=1075417 RepID=A0A1G9F6T6_9BACT|nr:nucleoside phosphorylase [Catalinimonas alkaloidigena]SDK84086.1 uridine phosphorylase [Catalinimonas alkaloidigena]
MISPADLILNPDGSVYHLGLRPEHLADTVLTVGDPERVAQVSQHFDRIEFQTQKREFVTHTGWLGKKRLTVISSGMGTDNVEILMTELDALVNVDLTQRTPHPTLRALNVVRLGTSGALHADLPIDSLLVSAQAVGLDPLTQFYDFPQEAHERALGEALQRHLDLSFRPYVVAGSARLQEKLASDLTPGLTLTCPGFYAPQGRHVRLAPRPTDLLERYRTFGWQRQRLTNFEMETAGYYALGRLLGHEVLSVNALVANRANDQFSTQPGTTVERMIRRVLERFSAD